MNLLVLGYTHFLYRKTPKLAFWTIIIIHELRNSKVFMPILFKK